ncbi:MAG TPA: hypothetical protein VKK81_25145 [Candidatus Binatia bacterium]|nr:hypothetical protein [Candidatus Binatia bacterium]
MAQSPNPGDRCCDVLIAGRPAQVKVTADGYKTLYDALDGVELAFLRRDRQPWLVVLRADDYLKLLRDAPKEE